MVVLLLLMLANIPSMPVVLLLLMLANIPSMPMSAGIGTGATFTCSRDDDTDDGDGIVAARPTLTPAKAWAPGIA